MWSSLVAASTSADGVRSFVSLKMEEVADVGVVGEWNAPGKVLVRDMSQARASCWLACCCCFTPAAAAERESELLVRRFASTSAQTERTHR